MSRNYPHPNLDKRRNLAKWLDATIPVKEIADNLDRAPSTIHREIKRNYYSDTELPQLNGYHAINAQDKYQRRRPVHRKLIRYPEIMAAVRAVFDVSPLSSLQAATAGQWDRLNRSQEACHPMRISHETIYRNPYSNAYSGVIRLPLNHLYLGVCEGIFS